MADWPAVADRRHRPATGDALLIWSRDDSRILGRAVRDDQDIDALLAWWQDVARFHD